MLVWADGRTVGTIGGGCYENDAFWKAREAIASGKQQLLHYELNDDFAQENGLICGGRMDVHIDPLAPSPRLFVIGAGHVGFYLAKLASDIGFQIHAIRARDPVRRRGHRLKRAVSAAEPDSCVISRASSPSRGRAETAGARGKQSPSRVRRAAAPGESGVSES